MTSGWEEVYPDLSLSPLTSSPELDCSQKSARYEAWDGEGSEAP